MTASDVIVVGAGVIGTAIAWRCAQRGLTVALVDPQPDRGAYRTAAGMLAPITELHYTESPLLRLNVDSLSRYPGLIAEVEDESGLSAGFRDCGTVAVAWDGADLAGLRDLREFAVKLGMHAELLTGRELRELEPAVAAGPPGGLLARGDHQVDPRLLHRALLEAGRRRGVRFVADGAQLIVEHDRATGVRLPDGATLPAGQVVLAAGAWSAHVGGVPASSRPPVRPVKGQTVHLRLPGEPRLRHVLRGAVKGDQIYLVPRVDGRIVVGANVEEAGFDQRPRAGAVYELLRDGQTLLPELTEAVWEEVSTGLRPGSPDNAPIVGRTATDGLLVATGHYRNGILLTPVTADGVAELVATGTLPEVLRPFSPARFAEAST